MRLRFDLYSPRADIPRFHVAKYAVLQWLPDRFITRHLLFHPAIDLPVNTNQLAHETLEHTYVHVQTTDEYTCDSSPTF